MGMFTIWRAIFHDDVGEECGKTTFKVNKPNFNYANKSYVVDLKNGTFFELRGILWNTRYYQYHIDSPFPYQLKKNANQIIDAESLNTQLESKVARDLNRINDSKLSNLFTPRNIIIGSIILVGLFILMTNPEIINSLRG